MNDLALIQEKGAPPGSARYYSLLALAPERREPLTALYALQESLHEVLESVNEERVAHARLGWWRQEIARLFEATPQHPATRTLANHGAQRRLPREELQALVDGAELALHYDVYPGFRELSPLLHHSGSTPTLLAARLLGYRDARSSAYAHHLGTALALLRRLLRVREDSRQGRFFLPEDELQRFDLDPQTLNQADDSEASRALFAFQAGRIRDLLGQAEAELAEADRYPLYPLLIRQRLASALLDELAAARFPLLSRRIHLTPLRKFWLAWRTLARERRRHRRLRA